VELPLKVIYSRDTLSPGQAKFFIFGASLISAIYGVVTLVLILREAPGVTVLHLVDVVVCLGVAFGIAARVLLAAWVGLAYCVLNALVGLLLHGSAGFGGPVGQVVAYGLAIISIGLYPSRIATGPETVAESLGQQAPQANGDDAV
jgi:hypothetical protein